MKASENARWKSPVGNPDNYSGPLHELCRQFVLQKRALGLKYKTEAYIIGVFDRFLKSSFAPEKCLTKESVTEFASKRSGESDKSYSNRATIIRQFGEFVANSGADSYILPGFKPIASSFVPYIYSRTELKAFFHAVDGLDVVCNSQYYHLVHPMLFRILYGCGIRIGEALALKVSDVNLDDGYLHLTNTKWNIERVVPMSKSLLQYAREYYNTIHSVRTLEYFLPSYKDGQLGICSVTALFKKILLKCDIPQNTRIHDFRHTFAVHSLQKWVNEGKDIYVCLPLLSKYLGHATIRGTEHYLRLTADVYPGVVEAFTKHFEGVLPEVV